MVNGGPAELRTLAAVTGGVALRIEEECGAPKQRPATHLRRRQPATAGDAIMVVAVVSTRRKARASRRTSSGRHIRATRRTSGSATASISAMKPGSASPSEK
jgi:hypothetical protein